MQFVVLIALTIDIQNVGFVGYKIAIRSEKDKKRLPLLANFHKETVNASPICIKGCGGTTIPGLECLRRFL